MMTQSLKEEPLLTRYLTGSATEEACVEIEERFLRDAEYLKRVRALECEIIDDYVRGELPTAEHQGFERRIMASPQGRQLIARARRLHIQLDQLACENRVVSEEREPAASIVNPRESLWEKVRACLFTPGIVLRYGMAAALALLLAGGLWLWREEMLSRRQIAQLTAERDSLLQREKNLQERLTIQKSEGQQLSAHLDNEKRRLAAELSRNTRLQQDMRSLAAKSSQAPLAEGEFVELALASGIERNPGAPRRLNIPTNIRFVKLQLELDPSVNHRSYRVELNTAGGVHVWIKGGLIAQRADWGRFVTFILPTEVLQAGEYELVLHGLEDERKSEVAGYYYFIASISDSRK